MKHPVICLAFFLYSSFSVNNLYAQQPDSLAQKIADQMDWYAARQPSAVLFVHFDKNIYTNNENVWFTGYLLRNTVPLTEYHALSVALVRNIDRAVFAADKFFMSNGLAFGNMFLPDSLPTGNYSLIAYTNRMVNGLPDNIFIQPITVKTGETKFISSLQLVDSVPASASVDSIRVLLNARTKDYTLIADAVVNYSMGDSLHRIIYGKTKTDRKGEVMIMVPAKRVTADNCILTADIHYGKETKTMRLQLPVYQRQPSIKFYPEGGYLVDGVSSVIGWEAKTAEGEPLPARAILFKDGKPVDTIQTNSEGMGRFRIRPDKQSVYTVVLPGNAAVVYPLPEILPAGPTISITNALVNDTLHLEITNTDAGKLLLLLHNYKETFTALQVFTQKKATKKIDLVLTDIPKGLAEITLLDSTGKPMAERIFFAHYDKTASLSISTDSAEYGKRQKVQVKLKLSNEKGEWVKGMVSFACVQDNRVDIRKRMDIDQYLHLKNELANLPFKNKPMNNDADNKAYLENIFLIRGWSRYNWRSLEESITADTIQRVASLQFTANVVSVDGSRIKKPLEVGFWKDNDFSTFKTDSSGHFSLTPEQSVMSGNKSMLFIVGKQQNQYSVDVKDPYELVDKKLAKRSPLEEYYVSPAEQQTQSFMLKNNEYEHILPQVVVTNNNTIFNAVYRGNCTDYVCMYNVLNCPNHHFGSKPVDGGVYTIVTAGQLSKIVYRGNCPGDNHFLSFKGVLISKEFYVSDYSKFNPPDPELLSTVYWNHSVTLTNGEAELSFYTGDITGKFRIIVQGITSGESVVVSGDKVFEVK